MAGLCAMSMAIIYIQPCSLKNNQLLKGRLGLFASYIQKT